MVTLGLTRAPTPTGDERLSFDWPLPRMALTSPFGSRQDPMRRAHAQFHLGVDLGAPYGALVRAIASGRVIQAGWHRGHGRQVCIAHRAAFVSCYAHLAQLLVERDDEVSAGTVIGRVGSSGRSTGPHLHLELRQGGLYLDPLAYLGESILLSAEEIP